jgi:hypothetical protein
MGIRDIFKDILTEAGGGGKRKEMFRQGALDCSDLSETEKKTWKVCGFEAKKPANPKKGKKPKGKLFDAITSIGK